MTAAAASSAAAGCTVITVILQDNGGNVYGYSSAGAYGTRSPTVLYGSSILAVTSDITLSQLSILIAGVHSANFFNRAIFQFGIGASPSGIQSFISSAASFTNPGGNSSWIWAASFPWNGNDDGNSRFLTFYR